MEKVLAAWNEKKVAANNSIEKKENVEEESLRDSHGGHKQGGYGSRDGNKSQSLCLAQTLGGENDHAKVPKV